MFVRIQSFLPFFFIYYFDCNSTSSSSSSPFCSVYSKETPFFNGIQIIVFNTEKQHVFFANEKSSNDDKKFIKPNQVRIKLLLNLIDDNNKKNNNNNSRFLTHLFIWKKIFVCFIQIFHFHSKHFLLQSSLSTSTSTSASTSSSILFYNGNYWPSKSCYCLIIEVHSRSPKKKMFLFVCSNWSK